MRGKEAGGRQDRVCELWLDHGYGARSDREKAAAAQMEEEVQWIGSGIPLHVTRFFPRYYMTDREATDVQTVYRLANLAGKYVEDVFVENC